MGPRVHRHIYLYSPDPFCPLGSKKEIFVGAQVVGGGGGGAQLRTKKLPRLPPESLEIGRQFKIEQWNLRIRLFDLYADLSRHRT